MPVDISSRGRESFQPWGTRPHFTFMVPLIGCSAVRVLETTAIWVWVHFLISLVFVLLELLIAFLVPTPSHAQGSSSPGGSKQCPTQAAGSRLKIENYLGVPEDPISVFQFLEKVPAP